MSKRNIIRIITLCFWIYLGFSLISILQEIFMSPDWEQAIMQYSKYEIIIRCVIFIITRFHFKKHANHFNIFRN